MVSLTLADPQAMLWGGELILRDGQPVGHSGRYQIDIAGTLAEARVHLRAPFDPKGLRIRG